MTVRRVVVALSLLFPVLAQETRSTGAVDRTDPAGPQAGERARWRLALPAGWQTARPVSDAIPPGLPVPPDFVQELIEFDVATGVERAIPALRRPARAAEMLPGQPGRSPLVEPLPEAWNPDLVDRTAAAFPWGAQCRLFFQQNGQNFVGSGTLIDARTVITAGHCVHTGGLLNGVWSTNVVVAPAWDGDADAYWTANGVGLASFNGWTVLASRDYDMGFVRLDRPVGALTGTFGIGYDTSSAWFTGSTFNMAGFPGCPPAPTLCCYAGSPDRLFYGTGSYDTVNANSVRAGVGWTCDTGGVSGAGSYTISGNNRVIYAVHANRDYAPVPTEAGHTRMTQERFDYAVQSFIPGAYSAAAADFLPLGVKGPAVGYQGGRLSFDYTVFQNSLVDPAAATYTVDVYLSSNDLISTADRRIQTHTFQWDFGPRSWVHIVGTQPTIPLDVPAGNWYLGVIIAINDGNNANNAIAGPCDAWPIRVDRHWPRVPAGSLPIGSGVVIDFDGLGGVEPAWMRLNRLDAATRVAHADAWCNIGQLAACVDPISGGSDLELGLRPGASPARVANAMIVKLDGTGLGGVTLDFMAFNFGDITDADDGVWISDNGSTWHPVYRPWNLSQVDRWISHNSIDLDATPVSPRGVFMLLFAQEGADPFGATGGVAIDDIRLHPRFTPTTTTSSLMAGTGATIHCSSCTPNGLATIALSLSGPGPVPTPVGNLLLSLPVTVHATSGLSPQGRFSAPLPIPAGFTGTAVWFQSLDWNTLTLSNGLAQRIR
ncbi:MAG: trypsin-like serine protease [Planctomycetes bacterium]|nr:trypsin-like serine protease [Planctomycetota bacterium]